MNFPKIDLFPWLPEFGRRGKLYLISAIVLIAAGLLGLVGQSYQTAWGIERYNEGVRATRMYWISKLEEITLERYDAGFIDGYAAGTVDSYEGTYLAGFGAGRESVDNPYYEAALAIEGFVDFTDVLEISTTEKSLIFIIRLPWDAPDTYDFTAFLEVIRITAESAWQGEEFIILWLTSIAPHRDDINPTAAGYEWTLFGCRWDAGAFIEYGVQFKEGNPTFLVGQEAFVVPHSWKVWPGRPGDRE